MSLCSNKLCRLAKFQINSAKHKAMEFKMSNKLRYASPSKRLSKIKPPVQRKEQQDNIQLSTCLFLS